MSRQGRGLVTSIFKNFLESIRPRKITGDLVGKDYLGNEYYEVPSRSRKTSRYYKPRGGDEANFDEGLPAEWEAWLRRRRNDPPTEEEINRNLALIALKKKNALELDNKFRKTGEVPPNTLHGSFPSYPDLEIAPGKKPKN